MDAEVFDLHPSGYSGYVCPKCGDAWFSALIALDQEMHVGSWSNLRCNECGWEQG